MCRFYRRVNKERRDCSSAQLQQLSTHFNSTVPAKTIISKATGFSLIDFSCHIVALLQGTILVSFHTNTEMEIFFKKSAWKDFQRRTTLENVTAVLILLAQLCAFQTQQQR